MCLIVMIVYESDNPSMMFMRSTLKECLFLHASHQTETISNDSTIELRLKFRAKKQEEFYGTFNRDTVWMTIIFYLFK